MSQQGRTIGDLELNSYELKAVSDAATANVIRQLKNMVVDLQNKLQQVTADLAREKVKNSKEPEPKVIKSTKK